MSANASRKKRRSAYNRNYGVGTKYVELTKEEKARITTFVPTFRTAFGHEWDFANAHRACRWCGATSDRKPCLPERRRPEKT